MPFFSKAYAGILCALLFTFNLNAQERTPTHNPSYGKPNLYPGLDIIKDNIKKLNKNRKPAKTSDMDSDKKPQTAENPGEKDKEIIKNIVRDVELPKAKIWGQQFFRNRSINIFDKYIRDVKVLGNYEIGVGDEFLISVWGYTNMSANVTVEQDGFIDMSGDYVEIPRLYVKGMTFSQAKEAIISRLSRHMNIVGSRWDINLNFKRNITVNIVNEVFTPGSYRISAVNTAFNALVVAGGPNQNGSVRKIQVRSGAKPTRILDVYEFLTNPEASATNDFFLENNDFIYVPRADRVVEIAGSVNRPFHYELIEGEELKRLLFYAGGLRPDAYKTNIRIIRFENDEERLVDLNLGLLLDGSKDFKLRDGDKITVSPIQQAYSNYVSVLGAVKLPGRYELTDSTRVREVLLKSGAIYSAAMDRAYIKRLREDFSIEHISVSLYAILKDETHEDNIYLRPLDEIELKYKNEFIDDYNIFIGGAIRKPGAYQYSKDLTLADLIFMANGIRQEAIGSHIELSRLTRQGDSTQTNTFRFTIREGLSIEGAENHKLEPYDRIYVHQSGEFQLPSSVTIAGEVRFPGIYTITSKKERVVDLIKRAGGFSEIAFLKGARLHRKEDGYVLLDLRDMIDQYNPRAQLSRFNYILKNGDVITIPKLKDLVSIAGRVNHPYIKENEETREKKLAIKLAGEADSTTRLVMRLEHEIRQKQNPVKVNVPYHKGKNARFYIKEYGAGIDRLRGGRKRLVYVKHSNGLVKKSRSFLFFRKYPVVEKGAMVFVEPKVKKIKPERERKPLNVSALLTNSFALISSGLTSYLLIKTALSRP